MMVARAMLATTPTVRWLSMVVQTSVLKEAAVVQFIMVSAATFHPRYGNAADKLRNVNHL